jgi:bacillithiol biosynthesis cysteine-adding enzyme BshC
MEDAQLQKQWRNQVGGIILEEEPRAKFFSELHAALQPTAFTDEVLAIFERCYAPGKTFVEGFAALLSYYFAEDGLLLFDASTPELKALGADLFRREIETTPELSEKIVLQSGALEENYHAQVKPRSPNLFYINDDGDRLPLIEHEKTAGQGERSFFLKGTRRSFTLSELEHELDEHPERFSPNVVMRPLFQDTLLPTIAYVAGPGEIAYFAQFRPGYEWAGLPMPLIHPRLSATIVEERLEHSFTKFHITAEDILADGHGRSKALLDAAIDSPLGAEFEEALSAIDQQLESLRSHVAQADATLDGALTSIKGKVLTTVRDFQNKTQAAERKRHSTTKAQLDKLFAVLLPGGELQERELNLVYFLNKYGLGFLQVLKNELALHSLEFTEHHVIHMSHSG